MPDLVTDFGTVPVVILCGGNGIYIDATGVKCNKALVRVDGEPMVIHVMRLYLRAGYRSFVVAGGYQCDSLASTLANDYAGAMASNDPDVLELAVSGIPCSVRVVAGPEAASTGDRLKACRRHIAGHPWFCLTYSDTLCDVNLTELQKFHASHGKVATLLAAEYPTRFRILGVRRGEAQVRGFASRPVLGMEPINGGFYFFDERIFAQDFLGGQTGNVVLEDEVLERLVTARQLMAFSHHGTWQNLDSERDIAPLSRLIRSLPA